MSQRSSWRRAKRSRKSGGSSSATQEMDQAELDMLDMLELIDAKKQKDALAAPVKSGDLVYDMMDKASAMVPCQRSEPANLLLRGFHLTPV